MKNIVIVAPHPDDETLGAGGTLLKHIDNGDNVFCIFVTNVSEATGQSKDFIEKRQQEISTVAASYGFKKIFKLDYLTTKLTYLNLGDLIADFSRIFKEIRPQVVYLPNKSDVHSDHRVIFNAAYSCTKSFRYPFIEKILMYETVSETEFGSDGSFNPNYFVNIEKYISKKIDIMKTYSSELQNSPYPRSIENIKALATFRGAMISKNYAEAFCALKIIDN